MQYLLRFTLLIMIAATCRYIVNQYIKLESWLLLLINSKIPEFFNNLLIVIRKSIHHVWNYYDSEGRIKDICLSILQVIENDNREEVFDELIHALIEIYLIDTIYRKISDAKYLLFIASYEEYKSRWYTLSAEKYYILAAELGSSEAACRLIRLYDSRSECEKIEKYMEKMIRHNLYPIGIDMAYFIKIYRGPRPRKYKRILEHGAYFGNVMYYYELIRHYKRYLYSTNREVEYSLLFLEKTDPSKCNFNRDLLIAPAEFLFEENYIDSYIEKKRREVIHNLALLYEKSGYKKLSRQYYLENLFNYYEPTIEWMNNKLRSKFNIRKSIEMLSFLNDRNNHILNNAICFMINHENLITTD